MVTAGIPHRGLGQGLLLLFLLVGEAARATAQVRVTGELAIVGAVEAVTAEGIVVRDEAGTRHEILVHGPTQQGIAITGGGLLAARADLRVTSAFPVTGLKPGQLVRVSCRMDRHGKTTGSVTEVAVLDDDAGDAGVVPALEANPGGPEEFPERVVTGRVKAATTSRVVIELPAGLLTGNRTTISCQCAAGAVARLESRDPGRIEPGARVSRLSALRLSTGDLVARTLVVENPAAKTVADKGDDALERKYRQFSDQPPDRPRLVRSRHFAFMTDVSDREWAVIRDKLERMVRALEGCLGRPMTDEYKVEGFVVRDLARFPAGLIDDPFGVEKISRGEGVCVNSRQGRLRHARLYSCANHDVIQHECVHGICHLTFGSAGPTWLAEGLAELGSYWREDDQTVDLPVPVANYLQHARPKRTLLEIAKPGQTPAGTWQDYAWRWALCHLLANNPNYAKRFAPLAIALMEGREGASFEDAYGPVAQEVSFEYDQFLATLGNGYRSDLTAWPWKATFQRLGDAATARVKIKARAGWQASRVLVDASATYEIEAQGTWRVAAAGQPLDANGDADGSGRLAAAVFADFQLSPQQPLGVRTTVRPAASGQLFLRCADAWTELADNEGEITVTITRAK